MEQKQRSILSLNVNCSDLIFDHLSLKDLCSIGKTCKHLQNVAGEYFRRMYSSKSIYLCKTNDGCIEERVDGFNTNFAQYAQQLDFFNNNLDGFRYAAANGNQYLKSIHFDVKSLSLFHSDCITNIVKNVENVTFFRCFENAESFHQILQHCENLNCLTVYNWPVTKHEWPSRKYPKLECLEVFGKYDIFIGKCESLMEFLQQNQQLKKFSTSIDLIQVLDLVEYANIKLDKLSFIVNGIDKMITKTLRNRVKRMHKDDFFKKLQMFCYWGNEFVYYIDDIKNVPGLSAVEIAYIDPYHYNMDHLVAALTTLEYLKELRIFHCNISSEQAYVLSQYLMHLEKIHLGCNNFDTSTPFIKILPNLKALEIGEKDFDVQFNIKKLDEERGNIPDVVKLSIYVPEETFLDIKWKFKYYIRYRWIQFK